MADAQYWIFVGIVLQSETYTIRSAMLEILIFAIKNTLLNKGQLHEYIS